MNGMRRFVLMAAVLAFAVAADAGAHGRGHGHGHAYGHRKAHVCHVHERVSRRPEYLNRAEIIIVRESRIPWRRMSEDRRNELRFVVAGMIMDGRSHDDIRWVIGARYEGWYGSGRDGRDRRDDERRDGDYRDRYGRGERRDYNDGDRCRYCDTVVQR